MHTTQALAVMGVARCFRCLSVTCRSYKHIALSELEVCILQFVGEHLADNPQDFPRV